MAGHWYDIQIERRFRRFHWRIIKRSRIRYDGTKKKHLYGIERKTILFGIPLWWAFRWQYHIYDGVNYNDEEFDTYEEACEKLSRLIEFTKYSNRVKIVKSSGYNKNSENVWED